MMHSGHLYRTKSEKMGLLMMTECPRDAKYPHGNALGEIPQFEMWMFDVNEEVIL